MRIKLIKSKALETAKAILAGELEPETGDLEVIECIQDLAPDAIFYRIEPNGKVTNYTWEIMADSLEMDVEVRPQQ